MSRLLLLACASTAAGQKIGGVTGTIEKIVPRPNANGSNIYPDIELFRNTVVSGGGIYAAGWNADIKSLESWAYGFDQQVWSKFGDCSTVSSTGPFLSNGLLAWGGYLLALGGATDADSTSLIYTSTSAGPSSEWQIAYLTGVTDAHNGHRAVVFGGVLYMVGGLVVSTSTWSNAMWAVDLSAYFNSRGGTGPLRWVRSTQNGFNPFAPRGAHSLDVYAGSIIMFGGLTRNPAAPAPAPGKSVCSVAGAQCVTFNDLWSWSPGVSTGSISPCNGNCGWTSLSSRTASPPARFDHASGILADNMYVWGGIDASGARLTDLWAFNFEARSWTQVTTTWIGPLNAWPLQTQPPAGLAVVGHRLYWEATGDEGGNALYRYTPEAVAATPAPEPAAATSTALGAGVTFAAIFSVLNSALLGYFVYRSRQGGVSAFPSGGASGSIDVYAQLPATA